MMWRLVFICSSGRCQMNGIRSNASRFLASARRSFTGFFTFRFFGFGFGCVFCDDSACGDMSWTCFGAILSCGAVAENFTFFDDFEIFSDSGCGLNNNFMYSDGLKFAILHGKHFRLLCLVFQFGVCCWFFFFDNCWKIIRIVGTQEDYRLDMFQFEIKLRRHCPNVIENDSNGSILQFGWNFNCNISFRKWLN